MWRVVRLRKNNSTGGRVGLRAWDIWAESWERREWCGSKER